MNLPGTEDAGRRLTYAGTLDDRVQAFPWPSAPVDRDTMTFEILSALMHDRPLLLNDGYLVANQQMLASLVNVETGLMPILIRGGFIRLFTRGESIDIPAGIEAAAASGVTTHAELVRSKEWATARPGLEELGRDASRHCVRWPRRSMGWLFHAVLTSVLDRNERQLGLERDARDTLDRATAEYERRLDHTRFAAARTHWQKSVESVTTSTRIRTVMMNLANEAYHVAYSIAATESLGTDTLRVATAYSLAFKDYLDFPAGRPKVDDATLARLASLMLVPPRIEDDTRGAFLQEFFGRGDLRDEFAAHRREYLRSIDELARGGALGAAKCARDAYARILARLFAPAVDAGFLAKAMYYTGPALFGLLVSGGAMTVVAVGTAVPWLMDRLLVPHVGPAYRRVVAERAVKRTGRTFPGRHEITALAQRAGILTSALAPSRCRRLLDQAPPLMA